MSKASALHYRSAAIHSVWAWVNESYIVKRFVLPGLRTATVKAIHSELYAVFLCLFVVLLSQMCIRGGWIEDLNAVTGAEQVKDCWTSLNQCSN